MIFSDIWNEITTILTLSTSEGGEWGMGVVTVFVLVLQICNVNILMY